MPSARTTVTEIITGLAMTGGTDRLENALKSKPSSLVNVPVEIWDEIVTAYQLGQYKNEFFTAWSNGQSFLAARDALRGRIPIIVEWRGPEKTLGYDVIPADLRVDHVYLVSCKYLSKIIYNGSPSNLFDHRLVERHRQSKDQEEWYLRIAPSEYQIFYSRVSDWITSYYAGVNLPKDVRDLDAETRQAIRNRLPKGGSWPFALQGPYLEFSHAVAQASARRWTEGLIGDERKLEMLWRLLRLAGAPYFILGTDKKTSLRLRILTPWDWHRRYRLRTFIVQGDESAGQPSVLWKAEVSDVRSGGEYIIYGHVEIRWGHGRFKGACEAKVYIDTPLEQVPGYVIID